MFLLFNSSSRWRSSSVPLIAVVWTLALCLMGGLWGVDAMVPVHAAHGAIADARGPLLHPGEPVPRGRARFPGFVTSFGEGVAVAGQQTADGGYILGGETYGDAYSKDGWVIKTDSQGSPQWQKRYGGDQWDYFSALRQTSDGGYIAAGTARSFNDAHNDEAWLVKLDAGGAIQWQKNYPGEFHSYADAVRQTSDGGYIVAGSLDNSGMVLKVTSAGDVTWWKTYDYEVSFHDVVELSDGYAVVGEVGYYPQLAVLRLDASGGVVWYRTYSLPKDRGSAGGVLAGADDSLWVTGTTWVGTSPGDADMVLLRLDPSGNVTWAKTYTGQATWDQAEGGYDIQGTASGVVVAGYTLSFNTAEYPTAWVLNLDAAGNVVWERTLGTRLRAYAAQQTAEGGYAVFGGELNTVLTVTDANGNVPGCSQLQESQAVVTAFTSTAAGVDVNVENVTGTPHHSTAAPVDTDDPGERWCEPLQYTLTVEKSGTGDGTVTSDPAGISCGDTCTAQFTAGTAITLTAQPASCTVFAGWSGDADCRDGVVTLDADTHCTATFRAVSGRHWYTQTLAPVGSAGGDSALALDSAGHPHVSYYSGVDNWLHYMAYDGSQWHDQKVDAAAGTYNDIALDHATRPHISYFDPTHFDLKYACRDCFGHSGWQTAVLDQTPLSTGLYTSLDLDTNGLPHIAYYDYLDPQYNVRGDLRYIVYDGSMWITSTVDSQGDVGSYASLALDGRNRPHIAYWDADEQAVKYAHHDGTGWHLEVVDSGLGIHGGFTSLALGSGNRPQIAYYDMENDRVMYVLYEDGHWMGSAVAVGGAQPSLAVDASGAPHVSYTDADGHLGYAREEAGTWQREVVDAAGRALASRIGVDSRGLVHIVYFDYATKNLRYARREQCGAGNRVYLPLVRGR